MRRISSQDEVVRRKSAPTAPRAVVFPAVWSKQFVDSCPGCREIVSSVFSPARPRPHAERHHGAPLPAAARRVTHPDGGVLPFCVSRAVEDDVQVIRRECVRANCSRVPSFPVRARPPWGPAAPPPWPRPSHPIRPLCCHLRAAQQVLSTQARSQVTRRPPRGLRGRWRRALVLGTPWRYSCPSVLHSLWGSQTSNGHTARPKSRLADLRAPLESSG